MRKRGEEEEEEEDEEEEEKEGALMKCECEECYDGSEEGEEVMSECYCWH